MQIRKDSLLIAKKFVSIMETKLCSKIFLTSSKFLNSLTLKVFKSCSTADSSANLIFKDFLKVHFHLFKLINDSYNERYSTRFWSSITQLLNFSFSFAST